MIYYDLSPRLELSNPCSFMIAYHVLSDLYVFDLHIKMYVVAWNLLFSLANALVGQTGCTSDF
jgi:hypothetical protein